MDSLGLFMTISRWIFLLSLGYYLMTNLQWYHYKIDRVLFKHHKWKWHVVYFFLPLILFLAIGNYFYLYLYLVYLFSLLLWIKALDKPLIFTGRIKRFFAIYIGFILFGDLLYQLFMHQTTFKTLYLLPLLFSVIVSDLLERILLNRYTVMAREKLESMPNLIIIAITGSYGKTSLKNFLTQILENSFRVHATARSINTLTGIIADINENLTPNHQIYIVEAGARAKGDIAQIANLINPHYAIIGKIGAQHLEYFKTLDAIYEAKFELAQSNRLKMLFSYRENRIPENIRATLFPQAHRNTKATLEGISFDLLINGEFCPFSTTILGEFNLINLSAAILMAHTIGVAPKVIQERVASLKPVAHRLQKIEAGDKLILDDSYNGNLEGMLEAIRLASLYEGRKVIITPGLVESTQEANETLAKAINAVFDIAILTGELNLKVLSSHIHKPQKIILKEKGAIQELLKATLHEKDLILFANDAPSYI